MGLGFLKAVLTVFVSISFLIGSSTIAYTQEAAVDESATATPETASEQPVVEPTKQMETAESALPESGKINPNDTDIREKNDVDKGMREFFDDQTNKLWQYIRPVILLRTGFIHEQWDNTNSVFRQAGFKVFDAQIGFKGNLDEYRFGDWALRIGYLLKGNFTGSNRISDTYAEGELYSWLFSTRLKMGVMKVPFLYSEMESDAELYFWDRPQYASPYGKRERPERVSIGLGRHAGANLRFGFLGNALTVEGGAFSSLTTPNEEKWDMTVYSGRIEFNSKKWIHDRVRLEVGGGSFYQHSIPERLENTRYSFATDARLFVYGAFVGGEWALQTTKDVFHQDEYSRLYYKNNWSRAMGYQIFAGYSFPKREYELAVRYQWWDPDDTNIEKPIPQEATQALRWITASASWWPIDLVRVMLNYTHKEELEAAAFGDYSENRLKNVDNDEVVLVLQITI